MSFALAAAPQISNDELRRMLNARPAQGRPIWLDVPVWATPATATPAELLAMICARPFQGGLSGKADHLDLVYLCALTHPDGRQWRAGLAVDRVGDGTLTEPQPAFWTLVGWQGPDAPAPRYRLTARSSVRDEHRDLQGHLLDGINLSIADKTAAGFAANAGRPDRMTMAGLRQSVAARLRQAP